MGTALRALISETRAALRLSEDLAEWDVVFRSEAEAAAFMGPLMSWMLNADYYKEARQWTRKGDTATFRGDRKELDRWLTFIDDAPKPLRVALVTNDPFYIGVRGGSEVDLGPKTLAARQAGHDERQNQVGVLTRAVNKKPDASLAAALNGIRMSADWVSKADEATLKKIRHELYKRGFKKDADLFRSA